MAEAFLCPLGGQSKKFKTKNKQKTEQVQKKHTKIRKKGKQSQQITKSEKSGVILTSPVEGTTSTGSLWPPVLSLTRPFIMSSSQWSFSM